MEIYRLALIGFGNVGQGFAEIPPDQPDTQEKGQQGDKESSPAQQDLQKAQPHPA